MIVFKTILLMTIGILLWFLMVIGLVAMIILVLSIVKDLIRDSLKSWKGG